MLKPTEKIWHNGRFIAWDDAKIHVLSHVTSYGSSVFEGVRCYSTPAGPAIFRVREHLRRLHDSAKIYRIELKYSIDQLADAMVELVRVNGISPCYIRPIAMRVQLETHTSTPLASASSPRYFPHSQQAMYVSVGF